MFIDQVVNSGALPVLEATMQFATQRHRLILHNIANLSTPQFQPKDASPVEFQSMLSEAVDTRRAQFGGNRGPLRLNETREIGIDESRGVQIRPQTPSRNVLFHDRNNRDLERTMQDLAENVAAFRVAAELFRSEMAVLQSAIALRP